MLQPAGGRFEAQIRSKLAAPVVVDAQISSLRANVFPILELAPRRGLRQF
jgi:hypothetical protein